MSLSIKSKAGFSLVELMVVLSIVGIIVTLALPKFKEFQVRARQAEARSNLRYINTLQIAYHSENNIYAGFFNVENSTFVLL